MDEVSTRADLLSIHVRREGAIVTVCPAGEIDMATAGLLLDAILRELEQPPAILVVDLEPVRFLASMGLAVLARADRAARESGTDMRIVASSRMIVRTMELTGLTEQLSVYGSYSDARAGRSRSPRTTD